MQDAEMIHFETILGIGGRRGKFKYDILDTLQKSFVNATMYPYTAQKQKKKEIL
jgi:hypothetical protein